jgi:hypothetical protein
MLLAAYASVTAWAQGTATLEVVPGGSAAAGATVTVRWSGPNGRGDYITIARRGAEPNAYLDYRFTSNGSTPVNPVSLVLPAEPGEYEIRYLLGNPRRVLAAVPYAVTKITATVDGPAIVAPGASFAISWSGPNNRGDWLTIITPGARPQAYGSYVDAAAGRAETRTGNRSATLRAPAQPGRYELRYVQQGTHIIGTRAIDVAAGAATAPTPPPQLTATPLAGPALGQIAATPTTSPSSTTDAPLDAPATRSTRPTTGGGGLKALPANATTTAAPAATALDMNVFGTQVFELPVPLTPTPAAGSYQATCINITQRQYIRTGTPWTRTTLSAQCRSVSGIMLAAALYDPQLCVGDISNDNGRLGCARAPMTPLPGGSWLQSCLDPYYHPQANEIRARCLSKSSLTFRDATLNRAYPCASVTNDDGWLSCDTAPLPQGPWRAHCREASLPLAGIGFSALCIRASDNVLQRTTLGPCSTIVDVLDGYLTCGLISGLPSGNWSQRCRPVNWDAKEPAISVLCRNVDQHIVGWRFSFAAWQCPTPLFLDYGGNNDFSCVPPPVIKAGG